MATGVLVLGVFIVAIGVVALIAPNALIKFVKRFRSPAGLWYAVCVRLVMGTFLILAAPECRLSAFVNVIGILALVAAVGLPILGTRRFIALIDWWVERPPWFVRLWILAGGPFGALFIYAGGWPS